MPTSKPQRILVRGVNWVGDAVMSTPALLRVREAYPQAHITLLTHAKLKELYLNHPAVDEVRIFRPKESPLRIGWRLRSQKYDLGLILPNSPRSALEMFFAGVKERVGYARPWRNWILTKRVVPRADETPMHKRSEEEIRALIQDGNANTHTYPQTAHHIHQYLHLAAAVSANPEPVAPKIVVPDQNISALIEKFRLRSDSVQAPLWLGLNVGAEYGPAKRWPEERFTEAAIEIQRRTKCRWLVFGVKTDIELSVRIATNIYRATENLFPMDELDKLPHVISLVGKTSLAELCAGLKLCRVLLTNDSGPMHVAAALGVPVVVPFGSTSPELTGPWTNGSSTHQILQARAACSPCFLRKCPIDFRCMHGISVGSAVDAVLRVLR